MNEWVDLQVFGFFFFFYCYSYWGSLNTTDGSFWGWFLHFSDLQRPKFFPVVAFFFRCVKWHYFRLCPMGCPLYCKMIWWNSFFFVFFLACSRACADIIQRWWLNGAHAQRDSAIRLFSKDLRPKGWWWNVFQSGVLVLTAVQRACRYERRKEKRKKKTHSIAFKRARQKEKSSWQLQIKGFTQIYKNIQISRQWDE